jgi:hypothetical protein
VLRPPVGPGDDDRWRTAPCAEPRGYVCERSPFFVRPGTTHAYRVVHGRRTFDEAAALCARWGGHLATFTDEAELSFVAAKVGVYAWIGATDRAREGAWAWTTGEPTTVRAFAAGQPNDPDGTHDCLALDPGGRWHDWRCDYPYAFVCEVD